MRDLLARCLVILSLCCGIGAVIGWWWYAQEIGHDSITSELTVPADVSRQICLDWNLPIEEGKVKTDLPVSVAERAMQWIVDHRSDVNVVDLPDAMTVATACLLEIEPRDTHHLWRLTWTTANPEVDIAAAIVRSLCNRINPPQEPVKTLPAPRRDDLIVQISELEREEQLLLSKNPVANAAGLSQSASDEKIRHWSAAVATARQRRVEAENRYTQIKADLSAGVSLDVIAARLPAGPMQAALLAAIERNKLQAELTQRLTTRKRLAEVYGRRHPQLATLNEQISELQQKIAATGIAEDGSPAETLAQALASELNELQGTERDLQDQLDNEQSQLAEALEARRAVDEVRQKLAARRAELSGENSRSVQKIQLASASSASQNADMEPDGVSSGITRAGFSEDQALADLPAEEFSTETANGSRSEGDSNADVVDQTFSPLVSQPPSLQRSEFTNRAILSSGSGAGVGAILGLAWLTLQRRRRLQITPVPTIRSVANGSTSNSATAASTTGQSATVSNSRPADRAAAGTPDTSFAASGSTNNPRTGSRSGPMNDDRRTATAATVGSAVDAAQIKPKITGPSIAAIDALRLGGSSPASSGKLNATTSATQSGSGNSAANGSGLPGTGQPLSAAAADEIRRRLQSFGREQ